MNGGPDAPAPGQRAGRWRRVTACVLGVALVTAGVWAVMRQGDTARQAWASIAHSPPWLIAAALLLPLMNLAVVSLSFWVLMRREGQVLLREMTALIGAAWLLNFLPMRPGLFGRVAYHRAVNGIPVPRAVRATVVGLAAGAAAVAATLAIAALAPLQGAWPTLWLTVPLAMGAAGTALARGRASGAVAAYAATFTLRYLDLLVWIARYAVVFALVGARVNLSGAVAFAAVCQAALVVPIVGNGLGVREWAIGLTAAAFPVGLLSAEGSGGATGLAADLVNRAAEVSVAVPVGLISSAWLARHLTRRADHRYTSQAEPMAAR